MSAKRDWPPGLLAFCDLGCNMELCVDTTRADLPVIRFEGVYDDVDEDCEHPLAESFVEVSPSLMAWIEAGCPTDPRD